MQDRKKFPNMLAIRRLLDSQPIDVRLREEVKLLIEYAEEMEAHVENLSNSKNRIEPDSDRFIWLGSAAT